MKRDVDVSDCALLRETQWDHVQRSDEQRIDSANLFGCRLLRLLRLLFFPRRRCSLGRNRHRTFQGCSRWRDYTGSACEEERQNDHFR